MTASNRGSTGKVAFAILIDVSSSMGEESSSPGRTFLARAIHCASRIILRQIFSGEMNEISIFSFGSNETNNELAINRENYQNISIVTPLKLSSWDMLKDLKKLAPSSIKNSKWTEAIIVALDALRNATHGRKFGSTQIVLISNFIQKLKFSDYNLETLVNVMNGDNSKLVVIGYDNNLEGESVLTTSMKIMKMLSERLDTNVLMSFDEAEDELKYYIKKRKNPRLLSIFLEIGNEIKIPILWIKLNRESQRVTNIWRPAPSENETEESSRSNETLPKYTMVTDESRTANYGATKITLSYADLEALKRKPCKSTFTLIGCTKRKNINPLMYVGRDIYVIHPKPNDKWSYAMLSSFVDALIVAKKVGIAKRVLMANGKINIGALIPLSDHVGKHLYFLKLPTAEWVRPVPSFISPLPTNDDARKLAVDKFIDSKMLPLDLLDKDRGVLLPNVTFQSHCHILAHSVENEVKIIKPHEDHTDLLTQFIEGILDPVPYLSVEAEPSLAELAKLFPLPKKEVKIFKRKHTSKDMNNEIVLDDDVCNGPKQPQKNETIQKLLEEFDKEKEIVTKIMLEACQKVIAENESEMSTQSILDKL